MKEYIPEIRDYPIIVDVQSAWGNITTIIKDIIQRFELKTNIALEFGVETGYSISAIANYFNTVIGVDTFRGDFDNNISTKPSNLETVKEILKGYPNIELIESKFEDYILREKRRFDLIHIDIIHTYQPTFDCGEWAVNHSDCVIFHDTVTFPEVLRAVTDLSIIYNLEFWNYTEVHGLGILVR
jgi:predicted O-methyltransferase YrrM